MVNSQIPWPGGCFILQAVLGIVFFFGRESGRNNVIPCPGSGAWQTAQSGGRQDRISVAHAHP